MAAATAGHERPRKPGRWSTVPRGARTSRPRDRRGDCPVWATRGRFPGGVGGRLGRPVLMGRRILVPASRTTPVSRMTSSGRLPIGWVRKRSLMRSDVRQVPPAARMAPVGRIRRTPGEPTAHRAAAGLPTPAMGAPVPSATSRTVPIRPCCPCDPDGRPARDGGPAALHSRFFPRRRSGGSTARREYLRDPLRGERHDPAREDPAQAPEPGRPAARHAEDQRRYQVADAHQVVLRRPDLLRRVPAQEREARPDLRRPRDACPDPRRVPRPESHPPEGARGHDRTEGQEPRRSHEHPPGAGTHPPTLPGEGLRPGRGQAARRGQSRRHQGRDPDLRGAQGQDRQHQLRRLPVRLGGHPQDAHHDPEADPGTLRQVSPRHAR